jgi:drug/metabolite transporter (DMT)-like permease
MITLLRVLFGYIIACLVAGAVTVAFVVTPADIGNLPVDAQTERLANAGVLALLAATHSAIFAFPFAMLANGLGEVWRVRSWLYYAVVGLLIGAGGFVAYYVNEVAGQPSIFNNYALTAFLTSGTLGGLAYWLFAGRRAGGRRADAPPPPAAAAPPPTGDPAAQTA